MTLDWTAREIADAVAGRLVGDPATIVTSVSTDTRSITPGGCFVAIAGERFDGHNFLDDAFAAGASLAVVSAPHAAVGRGASIVVSDTGLALRNLGAYRRAQLTMPVVAVTGSSGKTSTKDLLAAALPGSHASMRSFNNEIGVPLTVLDTPADAAHLVLEVGSRGTGHIAWLMPSVRPDVAVVTNLGVVHLETFGTVQALADAKFELVEGLDVGGTAVVPVDDPRLHRPHLGHTLTFGEHPDADVAISDLRLDDVGRPRFVVTTSGGEEEVAVPMSGEATTSAVVMASVSILVLNYFLTAMMFT